MKTNTGKFNSDMIRQWSNLIAILATFLMNIYVNISPPGGQTIGEISNTIFKDVLITPASYAFAIWGLIYLGLISFGIYQTIACTTGESNFTQMSIFFSRVQV